MRVIVCGSRGWRDRDAITRRLADLPPTATVVHGAAKGADRMAHQEAEKLGLLIEIHKPQYHLHGAKRAPLVRNIDMAESGADLCLAFWDGRSTGTAHMMEQAQQRGIPLEIIVR